MRRSVLAPAVAVVVFSGLLGSVAQAFRNEPDGFRGIAWGTLFAAVQHEMILLPGEGWDGTQLYHRKGDKMAVGGTTVQEIAYVFERDIFQGVMVMTKGRANRQAIISAFKTDFGEASQPIESMDVYYWWGGTTSINLTCQLLVDECEAIIRSTTGLKRDLLDPIPRSTGASGS
jgi:hypothetical protein